MEIIYLLILRELIGVVGQVVPWNFRSLYGVEVGACMAAGDTIVLKPSSHTSLSVLELVN